MIKMTRKRRTKRRPGKCPQILKGNHYEVPRDELETRAEVIGRLASTVHRKRKPGWKRFVCP